MNSQLLIICILIFIGLFPLWGCKSSLPSNPKKFSVELSENGGMVYRDTHIFLSNHESSYVHFNTEGIENKLEINPTTEELQSLLQYMNEQKFTRITTREEEALDRGGDKITVRIDGEKTEVSNMGFTFIRSGWQKNYSNILQKIYSISKQHVSSQLHELEIVLDSSLLKEDWKTYFSVNDGIWLEKNMNSENADFQQGFKVPVIVGTNKMSMYVLKKGPGTSRQNYILTWDEGVQIDRNIQKITLVKVEDSLAVFKNEELPSKTVSEEPQIVEKQNLKELKSSELLDIELSIDEGDTEYQYFELQIGLKDKRLPLLTAEGSLVDTYADIHYTLLKTGMPEAPFLLFFSGQAGDEYNTAGKLILFSTHKIIAELSLNDGNRIHAELRDFSAGKLIVKEALVCHQSIETTIDFSSTGFQRSGGSFKQAVIYPENESLPDPSHQDSYTLKMDMEVLDAKGATFIFKKGEKIKMKLLSVDFKESRVYLDINGKSGYYMDLEKFGFNELVHSMYGAKCEMG